jgi:hypothetical protein
MYSSRVTCEQCALAVGLVQRQDRQQVLAGECTKFYSECARAAAGDGRVPVRAPVA